ncbi:RNA helicase [Mycena indigotica]|uniref:RNA helicase n=1 Tax=Mycena indigotica TaxID=2126181 RepID=A0A8H6S442_9AGAR|nr:RNA helicase [Mycena indigotica]KAF7291968.1 RNA helicase [Mycena indigotica]
MPAICPTLLSTGSCNDEACSHRHDVIRCEPCSWVFATRNAYNSHIAGKKHQRTVQGKTGQALYCPICDRTMVGMSSNNWSAHKRSFHHAQAAAAKGISPNITPEAAQEVPNHSHCTSCDIHVLNYDWVAHCATAKHRRREQYAVFQAALDEAEKDRHGISISGSFDFGLIALATAQSGLVVEGTVSNATPGSKVSLISMSLASDKNTRARSPFTVVCKRYGPVLYNSANTAFSVTFCQQFASRAEDRLEILLEDTQLKKSFIIIRVLRGHVGNQADHDVLKPTAPYVPRQRVARAPETSVVEGIFPKSRKAIPYVGLLPEATIPANLASILLGKNVKDVIETIHKLYLPVVFDSNGYGRHFKLLLWVEEHRMENDLSTYDISDTELSRYESYHYLDVPGLAEKRPSVLVGDRILVQRKDTPDPGRWFEGGVHVVRQQEVGLRFHGSFKNASSTDRYSVRFKLNRYPLRRQHLALDSAFSEDRVLFPDAGHHLSMAYPTIASANIKVFNPLIAANAPQLQAVVSITKRPVGSVPFIIFGPPGTGKTVTMVEAILQVLAANPNARIIACAPSNSAADLIATRLMSLGTDALFRFYAPSRHKEQVDLKLRDFTHTTADGHFSVPPLARMKRFRAIVTTCVSASVISGIGIPRGHYSHIFVDEAGQATEPEAMIAIQTMADTRTNIILSGDPKQLGPIIRSNIARNLGLEISYIERLMQRDLYDEQEGYGQCVVKLTKNFRSHNAILKFPNEQFYKGELQPHGDRQVVDLYLNSSLLPKRGFPIIFHSLAGKDDREASSPSFFNIDEASQVKKYVEILRGMDRQVRTGIHITDGDIGVIAPYHAQCVKIRKLLKPIAEGVKVGSVEEFQGQERKVIIISTVRSSREFVTYDLRHTLGFVANPRRFNVAITRAQSLLIVVGDPNVLGLDPLWRAFLNYACTNGGWTGPDIPWDPSEPVSESEGNGYAEQTRGEALFDMNEFTRRMEELTVSGAEGEDDANVDRPWREAE